MANEIDWNRSLKRKLHVWRGSKRRPKSITTDLELTPHEYRKQWPQLTGLLRTFRNPYFVTEEADKARLGEYADKAEAAFNQSPDIEELPDPIFDALMFAGFDTQGTYDAGEQLPKQWFRLGARYMLEVIFKIPEALAIIHPDSIDNYRMAQQEAQDRALVTTVRRLLIAVKKDEEYQELLDLATAHFEAKDTSIATRMRLATIFPERVEWGNALIEGLEPLTDQAYTYTPTQRRHHHMLLFSSGADLEHILDLIELCDPRATTPTAHIDPRFNVKSELFSLYALLDRMELEAKEPLLRMLDLPWNSYPETLMDVLCNIPDQEVFDRIALAYNPGWKLTEPVRELFSKYPVMALQAIERRIEEKDDAIGDGMMKLREEFARVQVRIDAEASDEAHFADREDLTGILAAPPWHGTKKAGGKSKGKKIPKALKSLARIEDEIALLGVENFARERADQDKYVESLDLSSSYYKIRHDRLLAYASGESEVLPEPSDFKFVSSDTALEAIGMVPLDYCSNARYWELGNIKHLLGERPELYKAWIEGNTDKEALLKLGEYVAWSGMAAAIAECLDTKTMRDGALKWIRKHPRESIVGAIPEYFATRGAKKKKFLEEVIRVARKADEAVYEEILDAYGDEVREAMPDLEDAATAYPEKMPKLPSFWNPAAYPPILLEKDLSKKLPVEICDDIAFMLKFSPPGKPYVGLMELRKQADTTSLGQFTWGLFESWIKAECPLDEEWVIQALALFGGPEMVRKLPYQIDAWAKTNYYKRSEKILDAIQPGANEYTAEALWRCKHGGHDKHNCNTAHGKLLVVLGSDGSANLDTKLDRKAPTFGIGLDHTIKLTDGEGVKVWLDEELEPHLASTDASSLDEPTQLRWERLGKLCAWQARFQSRRFERAMRTQRAWSVANFKNDILGHPLLGMLAHKFLWGVFEQDGLVEAFRIDEGNEPVNVEDEPVALANNAERTIRLVHPLQLEESDMAAWVQTFADYEIIQPFEQLGRARWLPKEAQSLLEGELAIFETTTGALQTMYEDHDWTYARGRKRTYPEPYFSRQVKRSGGYGGGVSVTTKISMNRTSSWSPFALGTTPEDDRPCTVTLKFARKGSDYRVFDEVALSELVWELARARDASNAST